MVQIRQNLALRAEAKQYALGVRVSRVHQFDGNLLLVQVVRALRQVHLAHAAFPEHTKQAVRTNQPACDRILLARIEIASGFLHRLLQEAQSVIGGIQQRLHFFS